MEIIRGRQNNILAGVLDKEGLGILSLTEMFKNIDYLYRIIKRAWKLK